MNKKLEAITHALLMEIIKKSNDRGIIISWDQAETIKAGLKTAYLEGENEGLQWANDKITKTT